MPVGLFAPWHPRPSATPSPPPRPLVAAAASGPWAPPASPPPRPGPARADANRSGRAAQGVRAGHSPSGQCSTTAGVLPYPPQRPLSSSRDTVSPPSRVSRPCPRSAARQAHKKSSGVVAAACPLTSAASPRNPPVPTPVRPLSDTPLLRAQRDFVHAAGFPERAERPPRHRRTGSTHDRAADPLVGGPCGRCLGGPRVRADRPPADSPARLPPGRPCRPPGPNGDRGHGLDPCHRGPPRPSTICPPGSRPESRAEGRPPRRVAAFLDAGSHAGVGVPREPGDRPAPSPRTTAVGTIEGGRPAVPGMPGPHGRTRRAAR